MNLNRDHEMNKCIYYFQIPKYNIGTFVSQNLVKTNAYWSPKAPVHCYDSQTLESTYATANGKY